MEEGKCLSGERHGEVWSVARAGRKGGAGGVRGGRWRWCVRQVRAKV